MKCSLGVPPPEKAPADLVVVVTQNSKKVAQFVIKQRNCLLRVNVKLLQ